MATDRVRAVRAFLEVRLPPGSRSRALAAAGALGAALGALIGAWLATVLARAAADRAYRAARLCLRVATFRLYRPCADCRKRIHTDARVCRHCGYRKRGRAR